MNPITKARVHIRRELEAPPALRRFGSGWLSGVLGIVFGLAGLFCVLAAAIAASGAAMVWRRPQA